MQKFENRLLVHPALLQNIPEDDAIFNYKDGHISIVDDNQIEQMIFIYKNEHSHEFEVRIQKANPTDTYMPSKLDKNLLRYVGNDKFASFFFGNFLFARKFIESLEHAHPKYRIRPILESKKS